ncbi:Lariat debranching enzyme [Galdieria sulphuraria]|uniref:RNA lariat debranching enzyme n=1 Tax=Galdieria sulphuraria TaxID=130081 RepID=M2XU98_GALSU|nr:RNA lariat debranching enzyme [Galdieria sulphuraria]EME26984.1 RNA lariat debranching enzyme [Galdieria sulphuraria]GJD11005.1 Lariat debranching enzyme [Galdieria sulphuraria]|eukprot:XP_005703504.1 RNA lariat debranching enzyme [Galdieria sulphuraria]
MNVFVAGCIHGKLSLLYETVECYEREHSVSIDLILCCGDFQAVRNWQDLSCVCCPAKYRQLNDFYQYYRGELTAPKLTVFVGGNHEASNYLQELPLGGWVAPNIFYLGVAGVLRIGKLRIGGLSGIFKEQDFRKEHFERPPYTESLLHSVYHVREVDIYRLSLLIHKLDIFISHDWPEGVTEYGNKESLLKRKPFFRKDLEEGKLGNLGTKNLLFLLQPRYWFSAHMHCYFEAIVKINEESPCEFYALDKCLRRRPFYKIIRFPDIVQDELEVRMDEEWVQILLETAFVRQSPWNLLQAENWKKIHDIRQNRSFTKQSHLKFHRFCPTSKSLSCGEEKMEWQRTHIALPACLPLNPQTQYLRDQLNVPITAPIFCNCASWVIELNASNSEMTGRDPNEIQLSEDDAF